MKVLNLIKKILNKEASSLDVSENTPQVVHQINKEISDEYGILGVPKRNIWVFNSGLNFSGNPKWLFIYINKYRPDIKAFWLCSEQETVDYISSLGYKAYLYLSKEGIEVSTAAGVYVTEQCKEEIPTYLRDCVYLNLFHGVGCKTIERKLDGGLLFSRIMKKYVANNTVFMNNQLFLVTSPLMEKHFKENIGLTDDMVVKGAYPRCIYQKYYDKVETFDHNIRKRKNRDCNTKIVVYSPTFRETADFDFMSNAIPDMERLETKLKDNNQLFIFKMHPLMENDINYNRIKEKFESSPYFLFWDNNNDIYEIFDQIDTAIIDYSSIFYDFLAGGVKNFIRYFFDYDIGENVREGAFDYKEMTCGKSCDTFNELLDALDNCALDENEEKERQRIYNLFWQYTEENSMDKIIEAALNFKIKKDILPTLYTFDVFDTLISRKGLHPNSIFCKVKEQMAESNLGFERHFINSYIDIRRRCEANVREYRNKTIHTRNSDYTEISFDSIFERMRFLYNLSESQITFLKEKELETEINDTVAIPEMIAYVESLVDKNEDVLLISDMYLPSAIIKKMLQKVSEKIAEIPLYVSCEYGVHKSTGRLYQEVYKDIGFYKYGKWIHHGDNGNADGTKPASLGITTVKHNAPVFNGYENRIVSNLGTYDAYLVAAIMARFRQRNHSRRDYFSYAYASLCLVPYSIWVAEDAQRRGFNTLYFIARDGYHTQKIADIAIEKLGLNIKTSYIYGSRKAWRIPSFINDFDETFFLSFGSLAISTTYDEVLAALSLEKSQFEEMFPSLSHLESCDVITKPQMSVIISVVSASEKYRDYLLSLAAEKRVGVEKYLAQEIDFDEKFAFVDFWGRGYTQTCLTRLLHDIKKEEFDVPYYYIRSIYPSEGYNIRYNYTSKNTSMLIVEALCSSNIDYKSIQEYQQESDGTMIPVIEPEKCDMELLNSMRIRLCGFTRDFLDLDLVDRASTLRSLLDFSLEYLNANQQDPLIIENIATLGYALTTYAEEREYAPALTKEDVEIIADKKAPLSHYTNSLPMSLRRSEKEVVDYYNYLTKERVAELRTEIREEQRNRSLTTEDFKNKSYNFKYESNMKKERKAYRKAAKSEVENKIVIISVYENSEAEFKSLISVYRSKGFDVEILPLKGNYKGAMLKSIATAKYIFMSDVTGWFSRIKFRKETKLIQLFPEPLPLSGISQLIKENATEDRVQRILRIHNKVYALIPCAGKGTAKILKNTFVKKANKKRTKVLGNPLTDVYFSESAKEEIRNKLSSVIPTSDKKLIVYLPKSDAGRHFSYHYLDLAALSKLYANDYNLLVVSNKPDDIVTAYAESFDGFAYNGYGVVTQREALAVADVIVGDCTGLLLEGVLTDKPIFFTSKYVEKNDGSSLFSEDEILVAPVIEDAYDLIPYFEGRIEYDFKKYNRLKNRYFGACDGYSAERIYNFLEELEKAEAEKLEAEKNN